MLYSDEMILLSAKLFPALLVQYLQD